MVRRTETSPKARAGRRESGRTAKPVRELPKWREPQLATLVDAPPEGERWLIEMKYDGYRALIAIGDGSARVYTRRGQDWTDRFAEIAAAAAELPTSGTLIDGEIVTFNAEGRTDFSSLQKALSSGGGDLACFVFDILEEGGEDLARLPLKDRKRRLEKLMRNRNGPLFYSSHVEGDADTVLQKLCSAGHEGIIAKRAEDRYRSGRGKSWLKVKCSRRQELVIGGYTLSDKAGRPFASLLLGAYDGDELIYHGRVGTGFGGGAMEKLAKLFAKRTRKTSPFAEVPPSIARSVQYLTPDLVAEIEFTEFTSAGNVRHAVFKGLREDKEARCVVLEQSHSG